MSLSHHEQRVIDDLEGRLAASDPRLSRMLSRSGSPHSALKLAALGLVSATPGLALLILALSLESVLLGVVAFLVTAGGFYVSTLPSLAVRPRRVKGRTNVVSPSDRNENNGTDHHHR